MTNPKKSWSRLLLFHHRLRKPSSPSPIPLLSQRKISTVSSQITTTTTSSFYSSSRAAKQYSTTISSRAVFELQSELEKEKQRERESRIRQGLDTKDIDEEDKEDYLGVGPLIEKLEKERAKVIPDSLLNQFEEPTDSDSDDDDQRFSPEAIKKSEDQLEKKTRRMEELQKNFSDSKTLGDALKWMTRLDKFEEKHFGLRLEYRVIGDLMNRLKDAQGKEKFILQQKLNRAMRLVEWKEAYDPNNPANYGMIQKPQGDPNAAAPEEEDDEAAQPRLLHHKDSDDDEEEEFDDFKERDNILLAKLDAIDRKLEDKLAELDHTFGKKGKLLEEEIRDLAEERNALTEKKRKPMYRIGFDVKLIDINRTCKVTKGGQVVKYTAILACGNYNGAVGFAKAKGPAAPVALQKAYEKCFQNLHYIERHENHTIAHAIQTAYKKTKVYLWPASTRTGMKAGKTVKTILNLAGFKNVKSKVVGSRNPHNTVKALFKALNAIETPKDVQEKFGRTVVEKYLLQ
ncbi:hypothetical protein Tsubulata_009863 [Turnera subulata]|uniref:S5 DRBM domain-containing protein n=1 Tax=Turnera subulata TaxID=218843 RepID=A0A9Q0G6C8_9ROSI|nr:hypothetical protein Tsubulata_009863 [Turnera subulata]